ncbi:hypothetical protein LRS06_19050 [Hymenobacter sp. J193]|uniref:hypothetical protein n=1 Tax=Hymenobacter sp. J193 TaxID=2898429 RepID=UPI0021518DEE|nr:hypothetical protein [Hymenobacter sp. J193]MCR5889829.1 hypothetical protein [Hymenobacter sp. J193]
MPSPYRLYADFAVDFEARVRVLQPDEGGRQLPPYNGIRWDFRYAQDDLKAIYRLYPDFFNPETGDSWPAGPLPVDEWLHARISIFSESARAFHQSRIRSGTSFYYCEGSRIVAEGTVTRLTGLLELRPQP